MALPAPLTQPPVQRKARIWTDGRRQKVARRHYRPGEIIAKLREAEILIEDWRREYNEIRPHGSLGYRPPAPQTRMLILAFASVGGGRLD